MNAEKYKILLDYLIFLQPQISHLISISDIEIHQKELQELERLSEIGRATEYLMNCRYPLAMAEIKQIDCTEGGIYVTDVESLIDLYIGLKGE